MSAGTMIPFEPRPAITLEQLQAYADASGDPNRIHLDEKVAREMGLPGIIAHGMLVAGFVAERAQSFMEGTESEWRMAGFQVRFRAMTRLGDVISVGGKVKTANASACELELQAMNQEGTIVTSAIARFTLKPPR